MADSTDQEMADVQQNGGDSDMSGKDDDRKLFVGRLSWETTEKELRDHFGQFGEVENVSVKTDPQTGRSRGFAFVVFKDIDGLNKSLEAPEHVINNKKVDPKKAKARHGKIFVGGLDAEVTDEEIREYFGKFGTIMEVELPMDRIKNQRKNFCFITFESESVTNEILRNPKQTVKGKEVDVKRANPKGPDGGRGGGRGGRGGRGGPPNRRGGGGWNQGYGGYGGYGGGGGGGYGGGYGGYDYYNGGGYGGGGYNGYNDYSGGYGSQYGGGYGNYGGGGKQRGGGRSQRPTPY